MVERRRGMTSVVRLDCWDIVQRSLRTVWKYKFLWIFGFFVSIGGGGASNIAEEAGPAVRDFFMEHVEILVLVIVGLVILWLVLFVVNLISKAALIGATADADRGRDITLRGAWNEGLRAFWRMLGLLVIGVIAFLFVSVVCAIPIVLPLAAGAPGITIAVLIGAILLLPYLAFLFLLAFTITYAEREVVIERAGLGDALRTGWELTKQFFWMSLMVWLVMLLSGIIFAVGLVLVLLVLAVPFVLIGLVNLVAGLALGIPVGIVVVAVATGARGTYGYSVWTLAYMELKKGLPPAPTGVPGVSEPPAVPGVSDGAA